MSSKNLDELVRTPLASVGLLGTKETCGPQLEQLRQAQKMQTVGQLACGVAHDFNNLLTAILGNLTLIQNGLPPSDPLRPLVEATERAAWRAANLSRQLLGFSRRTLRHPEALKANLIVEEVVGLLKRTMDPRIVLGTRNAADLWLVHADPNQISQALMNLCLNARDAVQPLLESGECRSQQQGRTDQGAPSIASISLETANVVLLPQAVRENVQARPGEFIRLRVSDNGIGITAEDQARIFEPFFTTKKEGKGTGLGLAMVFDIVQQHDGWIECHSVLGQGTRFDIFLPRHQAAVVPSAALAESRKPRGGHETILLVDDEVLVRNLGRTILEGFGYHVLLAKDGVQALEVYQREQQRIELVVLDLTMPRLSGREALRRLREVNPSVRVLYASGYSAEHLTSADHEQVNGFVSKPYRPEDLARTVRAALDSSATARGLALV